MAASVRWLKLTIFGCLWIHICSHIQFHEYPQTTVCDGYDANLIWKYTSNESISSVEWHRIGSPDVLMADIFLGFTPQGLYLNRVTQAATLGNAAITLRSVTAADNGTYKCTVNTVNAKTGYIIVAEAPSSLPYFNKTTTSLTCNPPQNEGTPKVQTVLKTGEGNTLSVLTVHSSGTYQCCILGDAVKCLASTSNSSTEVCVNETYDHSGPTTEPSESTSPPPDPCGCPVLPCIGDNGFCVLWIIIIIVVVVAVVLVICIVWIVRRRRRKQNNKENKKENQTNKENNLELNKKPKH